MTAEISEGLGEGARAFGSGLVASAVGAYPIYKLLLALKSRQTVSEYLPGHQTKQGTPTMGGLIVIFGFLVGVALISTTEEFLGIVAFFLGFAVIGFLDDFVVPRFARNKRGLGWIQKLGLQVLVVGAVWGLGLWALGEYAPPLNVILIPILIAAFVTLFYSNAYNFTDGLDGLAGYVAIAWFAGYVGLYCVGAAPADAFPTACVLIGALIPFLVLNTKPAKVFMGDVGSLPIGAFMGMLVLSALPLFQPFEIQTVGLEREYALQPGPWPFWAAFILISGIMIVELVPVALQILSVKIRKKRLFLMTPIHHALEKKGWPEGKIVFVFAFSQLLLSAMAVATVAFWTLANR